VKAASDVSANGARLEPVRRRASALSAVCILLAAGVIGGCGDDGAGSEGSDAVVETVDPLPKLPPRWKPHVNRDGGFALGVPPGWTAHSRGPRTELRSPDRLVAVSIAADRTADAVEIPLRELARRTIRTKIPGLRRVEPRPPRPDRHRYRAVSLEAKAIAAEEPPVRERLELVVIRRERLANYTALIAEPLDGMTAPRSREAERALRTLRGRPIGATREAGLEPAQRSGRSG
jgi:hypothetical protein